MNTCSQRVRFRAGRKTDAVRNVSERPELRANSDSSGTEQRYPCPKSAAVRAAISAQRALFSNSPTDSIATALRRHHSDTASAKALRTIQQHDLKNADPSKRVLGVIRPTAEIIGQYTQSKQIGVLGTKGTVQSGSYLLEIENFFPDVKVYQQACPLWVPLIENGEYDQPGADFFVKLYLDQIMAQSAQIDTILLACTHYPIIKQKIEANLPANVKVVSQGDIVAKSLVDYLHRHPEMETRLSRNGHNEFYTTTDDTADFDHHASLFFSAPVKSTFVSANDLVKC